MAKKKKNKHEMQISPKHYEAFNYWFSLKQDGYNTTQAIVKTSEKYNVTDRTIRNWYDKMDWKKMASKRMKQIQKEVEKKENRTYAQNQKKYLDILHRLLYDYVEDGLPAKIETIKDLEIVIKNSLLLQDRPTEMVKQETEHSGNVEVDVQPLFDRSRMEQILEKEEQSLKEHQEEEYDDTIGNE